MVVAILRNVAPARATLARVVDFRFSAIEIAEIFGLSVGHAKGRRPDADDIAALTFIALARSDHFDPLARGEAGVAVGHAIRAADRRVLLGANASLIARPVMRYRDAQAFGDHAAIVGQAILAADRGVGEAGDGAAIHTAARPVVRNTNT